MTDGSARRGEVIRVLVVDDHEIVRRGIRALLATKKDIRVVAEAADGEEAVELALRHHPDVVLLDLVMPKKDGVQAAREIARDAPESRILVLTTFAADELVFPAIKAGAIGFLLKDCGPQELVQAIRQVSAGEPSLAPSIARKVLQEVSGPPPKPAPACVTLSAREVEILRQVARGLSNKEISAELSIGEETVHTHVGNILQKLHVASRTQAALYALREGIASLDDVPDPGGLSPG